jgi:HK97 family phage major capsid protein
MDEKELNLKLTSIESELKKFMEKHAEEVKTNGTASTETKSALDKLGNEWKEMSARLLAIEQKLTAPGGGRNTQGRKTAGKILIESEGFKALQKGATRSGQVKIGSFHKDADDILNAVGLDQPLAPMFRIPGIIMPGLRRLTIRDLMPSLPTESNLIAYARETGFVNSAAPQAGEGNLKAESTLTFALANSPVQTLAHWIPASRQILEDAPALEAYINARLLYGLKLVEETQLLQGDGIGNDISGLITNSTAFDATHDSPTDTLIDSLRRAMTQVQLSFFEPDGIVIHPRDWENIQLTKTTGSALNGTYVFSNPHVVEDNKIWGLPVVPTVAMPYGSFMVGAFRMGAAIWDRADATVEVSREHSDFFIRNLVAILCEERLALTVFRPLALIYGGFPLGS